MSIRNPFTCITCRVAFANGELQREHYKTDWHRYNLKRKVVELPAVTAEAFNEKVAEKQQLAPEKKDSYCTICRKKYKSDNAYKSHLQTRLHRQLLDASEKHDTEETEKQQDTTVSDDPAAQLQTETDTASLETPAVQQAVLSDQPMKEASTTKATAAEDMDEDSDAESWCSEDGLGLEQCLFCSFIASDGAHNLQHMAAKHSFFLPHAEFLADLDGLLAYLGQKVGCGRLCLWCPERAFRTVRAAQQHMLDLSHCRLRYESDSLHEYADFYDYTSSYPDAEADTDDNRMELDSDQLDTSGYELALPNGAKLGHRALRHFYRQNLPLTRARRTNVSRVLQQYKAIGWTGTTGAAARMAAKGVARAKRFQSQWYMQKGVKANKLMTHFREQNPI